ncbi:uncharacterized protein EI90DRAFT_3091986 [Cantharellus anzutake]|uniref:uncharacterized protein n=1 Tax=Cantharellus anzutake TaxID=1750568 RepID=UPI001902FD44|nr:uncharacterized protein EI90DRAFT_3091986 [Cantharellus anzutake]KAF8313335.1 hypothetical protein EI90DRAFT_3091986 [Cantharellus anzutake]
MPPTTLSRCKNWSLIEGTYKVPAVCAKKKAAAPGAAIPFSATPARPFRHTDAPALEVTCKQGMIKFLLQALRDHRSGKVLPLDAKTPGDERLVMVYSDIKPPNFLIDPPTYRFWRYQRTTSTHQRYIHHPHCRVFGLESSPINLWRWKRLQGWTIGQIRTGARGLVSHSSAERQITSRRWLKAWTRMIPQCRT